MKGLSRFSDRTVDTRKSPTHFELDYFLVLINQIFIRVEDVAGATLSPLFGPRDTVSPTIATIGGYLDVNSATTRAH